MTIQRQTFAALQEMSDMSDDLTSIREDCSDTEQLKIYRQQVGNDRTKILSWYVLMSCNKNSSHLPRHHKNCGLFLERGGILLILHKSFTGPTPLLSANVRGLLSFTVSASHRIKIANCQNLSSPDESNGQCLDDVSWRVAVIVIINLFFESIEWLSHPSRHPSLGWVMFSVRFCRVRVRVRRRNNFCLSRQNRFS